MPLTLLRKATRRKQMMINNDEDIMTVLKQTFAHTLISKIQKHCIGLSSQENYDP